MGRPVLRNMSSGRAITDNGRQYLDIHGADGVYRLGLCQAQFGAVRRITSADRAGAHGAHARIERAWRGTGQRANARDFKKLRLSALPSCSDFARKTAPTPSGSSSTSPRPATSRPEAAGAGPCGTPGANGKCGETLEISCGKTVGLLVAPISLLQSTQGKGIRVASSTAASQLVGLI
jgi:hypothetical protein